jgi:hypothetical protein
VPLGGNYPLKEIADTIVNTEVPVNVNLLAVGIAGDPSIGSNLRNCPSTSKGLPLPKTKAPFPVKGACKKIRYALRQPGYRSHFGLRPVALRAAVSRGLPFSEPIRFSDTMLVTHALWLVKPYVMLHKNPPC